MLESMLKAKDDFIFGLVSFSVAALMSLGYNEERLVEPDKSSQRALVTL